MAKHRFSGHATSARDEFLIQMPADRLSLGISYEFPDMGSFKDPYIGIEGSHTRHQNRVPADSDYLVPPPAYSLLGIEAGTTIMMGQQPIQIGLSVDNLTNVAYRDYLNRFRYFTHEMGRNYRIRVRIPFDFTFQNKFSIPIQ